MFEYFKRFTHHSAIYGIGNAITKVASIILIPIYIRVLTPGEYGTLEMFYVVASVMGTLLGMNIAHGTLRFYFEYEDTADKKRVISTSLIATALFSLLVMFFLSYYTDMLSSLVFKSKDYSSLFKYIFLTVFFQLLNEIGFAYLRVSEKAVFYIIVAIIQLVCQILFNSYLVVVLNMGIRGILIGNLLSIFVTWCILISATLKYCGIEFSLDKFKALFRYIYPVMLSSLMVTVVNNSDRVMLNSYTTLEIVGIYALGTKFGLIVRDLIFFPFSINFGQSRFAIMKQSNARKIYALVMTYFVCVIVYFSLGVSLFSKEILVVMSSSEYREAYTIVPFILIAIILNGMNYIFQTGILIEKKTKYIFILM
jgi:O-antigen/teichoic acid export membrane protein